MRELILRFIDWQIGLSPWMQTVVFAITVLVVSGALFSVGFFGVPALIEMIAALDYGDPANDKPPSFWGGFWLALGNKLPHVLGAAFFLFAVWSVRTWMRATVLPHRDLADVLESRLKLTWGSENADNDAKARIAVALIWKDTISFAIVIASVAWIVTRL